MLFYKYATKFLVIRKIIDRGEAYTYNIYSFGLNFTFE